MVVRLTAEAVKQKRNTCTLITCRYDNCKSVFYLVNKMFLLSESIEIINDAGQI